MIGYIRRISTLFKIYFHVDFTEERVQQKMGDSCGSNGTDKTRGKCPICSESQQQYLIELKTKNSFRSYQQLKNPLKNNKNRVMSHGQPGFSLQDRMYIIIFNV